MLRTAVRGTGPFPEAFVLPGRKIGQRTGVPPERHHPRPTAFGCAVANAQMRSGQFGTPSPIRSLAISLAQAATRGQAKDREVQSRVRHRGALRRRSANTVASSRRVRIFVGSAERERMGLHGGEFLGSDVEKPLARRSFVPRDSRLPRVCRELKRVRTHFAHPGSVLVH